jgi:uncharacterized C2H2 Zn-finger protein
MLSEISWYAQVRGQLRLLHGRHGNAALQNCNEIIAASASMLKKINKAHIVFIKSRGKKK